MKIDTVVFTLKSPRLAQPIYEVLFKDHDGTVLKIDTVLHGNNATPPDSNPSREGYVFTGWDENISNVTGDVAVYAQYSDHYTVRLGSEDNYTIIYADEMRLFASLSA